MGKQFIEENHHCQIVLGVGAHLKIEFTARNSKTSLDIHELVIIYIT